MGRMLDCDIFMGYCLAISHAGSTNTVRSSSLSFSCAFFSNVQCRCSFIRIIEQPASCSSISFCSGWRTQRGKLLSVRWGCLGFLGRQTRVHSRIGLVVKTRSLILLSMSDEKRGMVWKVMIRECWHRWPKMLRDVRWNNGGIWSCSELAWSWHVRLIGVCGGAKPHQAFDRLLYINSVRIHTQLLFPRDLRFWISSREIPSLGG